MMRSLKMGWLLAMLCVGCTVSPQPNPPSLTGESLQIGSQSAGIVEISGQADPPGAIVHIYNLSPLLMGATGMASAQIEVAPDGSFNAQLEGTPEQHYRIQVLDQGVASSIFDVTGPSGGGPALPYVPVYDCVRIDPETLFVDFGPVTLGDVGVERLQIRNDCAETINIDSLTLFAWVDVQVNHMITPILMNPGESRTVVVTFAPSTVPFELYDVLAISLSDSLTGSITDQIGISITGQAL